MKWCKKEHPTPKDKEKAEHLNSKKSQKPKPTLAAHNFTKTKTKPSSSPPSHLKHHMQPQNMKQNQTHIKPGPLNPPSTNKPVKAYKFYTKADTKREREPNEAIGKVEPLGSGKA